MAKDKLDGIERRTILQSVGTAMMASSYPLAAQAKRSSKGRNSYPVVNHDLEEEPVKNLLVDSESDPKIAEHPNHDRITFVTSVFSDGLELYLADGVESLSDKPSTIYQITSDSVVGVMDLDWNNGNRLEFWRDGVLYELKLPPSNKVFEPEEVRKKKIPNTLQENGGEY